MVKEAVEAAGGIAEMCRVGHSHVKAAMRGIREGSVLDPSLPGEAIFAGELSGHFFFKDCFIIDTSERAFLLALNLLSEGELSLSERIAPLRIYHHSGEINFRLPHQESTAAILDSIEQSFSDSDKFKLDGISVQAETWWLNVRPSNTEPIIRLTAESLESPDMLAQLVARVEKLIVEQDGKRIS